MSPLIWIAMPIGATLIAALWAMWMFRDRGPADVTDTVQAYRRFQETMSKNVKPLDRDQ
jgi:hypothetical protein